MKKKEEENEKKRRKEKEEENEEKRGEQKRRTKEKRKKRGNLGSMSSAVKALRTMQNVRYHRLETLYNNPLTKTGRRFRKTR
jgi:hypothetical protein